MPYSKNYPNPLAIWVSDKTKSELDGIKKKTGVNKAAIIRKSIRVMESLYKKDPERWFSFLISTESECQPPIS